MVGADTCDHTTYWDRRESRTEESLAGNTATEEDRHQDTERRLTARPGLLCLLSLGTVDT